MTASGPRHSVALGWLLAASLMFAVTWQGGLAGAAPPETEDARRTALRLAQEALRLFELGQYRDAITRFQAAQTVYAHRSNLYYVGEAYRRLGERRRSHEAYSRYAELLDPPARADFAAKLEGLRWEARCRVSISSTPAGAAVFVDGQPRGATPVVLDVAGGKHVLHVTLPGHEKVERSLEAEFGEPVALAIALSPRVSLAAPAIPASRAAFRATPGSPGAPTWSGPRRPPQHLAKHGAFVQATAGISHSDFGSDSLSAGPAAQVGIDAGYLLRGRWLALALSAGLAYTPVADAEGASGRAGFVLPALGVGGRLYLLGPTGKSRLPRLWLELRLAAGVSVLVGADSSRFLFPEGVSVSGALVSPLLRPSLAVGWMMGRGLTLVVAPAIIEYSPPHAEYAPEIRRVLRVGGQLGIGWER